jgi:hypothetical protein
LLLSSLSFNILLCEEQTPCKSSRSSSSSSSSNNNSISPVDIKDSVSNVSWNFLERAARPASWFGALEIINTRVLLIQGFSIQCVAELLDLGSVSAFGNLLLFFCFFSLLSRVSSTTCSHGLVP